MTKALENLPQEYPVFLDGLKRKIREAQVKASLSVNKELVLLYWDIGKGILEKQSLHGWGAKIIDQLSHDLKSSFPSMKGFSIRNLKYMRAFADAYPDFQIVQQAVAQIPWGHNIQILERIKDHANRIWYVQKTVEHGWSRDVLVHQIESKLLERQGSSNTNFEKTLPSPQSDLAHQLLKDPYNFDFLMLSEDARERELEHGLLSYLQKFMLELGKGFAFVGSQYHLEIGDKDFYVDLLFYHLKLRCYVAVELKMDEFKPEYAGKMNFYLSVIDDTLRHPDDQASIGLILCKKQNRFIAEYALRESHKPIGVSTYELCEALPQELKGSLPTIEELEEELEQINEELRSSTNEH